MLRCVVKLTSGDGFHIHRPCLSHRSRGWYVSSTGMLFIVSPGCYGECLVPPPGDAIHHIPGGLYVSPLGDGMHITPGYYLNYPWSISHNAQICGRISISLRIWVERTPQKTHPVDDLGDVILMWLVIR